jgi:hypothetical protein
MKCTSSHYSIQPDVLLTHWNIGRIDEGKGKLSFIFSIGQADRNEKIFKRTLRLK